MLIYKNKIKSAFGVDIEVCDVFVQRYRQYVADHNEYEDMSFVGKWFSIKPRLPYEIFDAIDEMEKLIQEAYIEGPITDKVFSIKMGTEVKMEEKSK